MQKVKSILGKDSLLLVDSIVEVADQLRQFLESQRGQQVCVITDDVIAPLHLENLLNELSKSCSQLVIKSLVIPSGEDSKCREWLNAIHDFLIQHQFTRDSVLVALGGGVIGDLTGYAAATYMRGIKLVQIPTTVLAMSDSSIGGKNGIDVIIPDCQSGSSYSDVTYIGGKNLVGTFWQPERIIICPQFLSTLSKRQVINGMAEVIKTACFWDEKLFYQQEDLAEYLSLESLQDGDQLTQDAIEKLINVIWQSACIKAEVVTEDEREGGLRSILNFGHTIGHAVEAALAPLLLHGEAISIGMALEMEIARMLGHLDHVVYSRVISCLQHCGLPCKLDDRLIARILSDKGQQAADVLGVQKLMQYMAVDKKNVGKQKKIVLLNGIGSTLERKASSVSDELIQLALSSSISTVSLNNSNADCIDNVIEIEVPGSKSISNRALLLAALGQGTCRLYNLLHSDDTKVMLNALKEISYANFRWENQGKVLVVEGCGGRLRPTSKALYLGNAGTAARFLTSVCALIQSPQTHTVLTGNARMKERPIKDLVEALLSNGCDIRYEEGIGCLPLRISNLGLKGGSIQLSASVSSQYVSSLLMAAPYAEQQIVLQLGLSADDHVVSQPYIDMTISLMKMFGVTVLRQGNMYTIPKTGFINPQEYYIEPDASSATYPLALAAVLGRSINVKGLDDQSLQGDAQFSKLLQSMGCTVQMNAGKGSISLCGPQSLKSIGEIDMESMTDAFMTMCALAAVCEDKNGCTTITGIANQRVKECNRIEAMVNELEKFGVKCEEISDGIKVHAVGKNGLSVPTAPIHCYDDHRIAMSMSILGVVLAQRGHSVTFDQKTCVGKTWPYYWDMLRSSFGVELRGDMAQNAGKVVGAGNRGKSIILIGMRSVGKSTLGRLAAQRLGLKYLDLDEEFEAAHGSVSIFVEKHGWTQFRLEESALLTKVLKSHSQNCVISTGGGVVESEANRQLLNDYVKSGGIVINLEKDFTVLQQELSDATSKPNYQKTVEEVWKVRQPLYQQCSSHMFFILPGVDYKDISAQFLDFVSSLKSGLKVIMPYFNSSMRFVDNLESCKSSSFFLSLTYEDLRPHSEIISRISDTVDAIELRVDLLNRQDFEYVAQQVQLLKSLSSTPVIYTVRSATEGGKFEGSLQVYQQLSLLGFKLGCEYVDIEMALITDDYRQLLIQYRNVGSTRIIASYHDVKRAHNWSQQLALQVEKVMDVADIIKLVGVAQDGLEDNLKLRRFVEDSFKHINKPVIAINMGEAGGESRILNHFMTPITHESLFIKAAPGQLSIKEIIRARTLKGLLNADGRVYLFGSPIKHSLSPALHNSGFSDVGLQYYYELHETDRINSDLITLMKADSFIGASVTIPLKEKILPFVTRLSKSAREIGAVNTVWKERSQSGVQDILCGDNTDWLGIRRVILDQFACLSGLKQINALVIGAGGTAKAACYALNYLGVHADVKLHVYNRTQSKAQILADKFHGSAFSVDSKKASIQFQIVVGTVPGDAQQNVDQQIQSNLFSENGGVYVELAYKPRKTYFMEQAASKGWKTVEGLEILMEQGFEQFSRWTGLRAPKTVMRQAVRNHQ
ncbi:hypothetical protein MP228_006090 [Amoeboaphelidium protococcarum]|nr:hypothetical protein MP228_006090 [Amoeboaphelidium protococcarum]